MSFASATTTDEVIEVDATSEPNTYGDNISLLSDGEDSNAGIPSAVVWLRSFSVMPTLTLMSFPTGTNPRIGPT